jgi:hypothetical protein
MTTRIFIAATLAALCSFATTSSSAQTSPMKGTVCFANSLRDTEHVAISCKGLGKFASVAEIYERGFRVVSSGVLPEAGTGTVFLIIEERK